jgi:hypothetical protein
MVSNKMAAEHSAASKLNRKVAVGARVRKATHAVVPVSSAPPMPYSA